MFNSNLAYAEKCIEVPCWDYIIPEVSKVFRLNDSERQFLENSSIAKIIVTIPFEANCVNPERIAISHLGIFLMEIKGFQTYCAHLPSDDYDIFSRLERISHYQGGDSSVIEHGMALLALSMLEGYKNSRRNDISNNTYNPLNSHEWNYNLVKKHICKILRKQSCPIIDGLFYSEPVTPAWWIH